MGLIVTAMTAVLLALGISARESSAQTQTTDDALAAQATDPTAALMSFQFNNWYTASFHGLDDSADQIVLRAEYHIYMILLKNPFGI